MTLFRGPLSVLRKSLRPFLMVNVAYFGLVGAGMAYGAWDRSAQEAIRGELKVEVPEKLPSIYDAYLGGHLWKAIGLTFFINLVVGSILYMAVPSLVIPYSGVVLGGVRALYWGVLFSPSFATLSVASLITGALIGVLIMLEGEGYALAMLGSYVYGKSWLAPASAGATTRWQGYKAGARQTLNIYALVAAALAVAAVYEATLVILIIPYVRHL